MLNLERWVELVIVRVSQAKETVRRPGGGKAPPCTESHSQRCVVGIKKGKGAREGFEATEWGEVREVGKSL